MTNCLICLSPILSTPKHQDYHDTCVITAFGSIDVAPNLKGTFDNFYVEAKRDLIGFSIAGVQAKFGLATQTKDGRYKLILSNQNSKYILKPCPSHYKNLDINEHVSQEIMRALGFDVPLCGILKFEDGTSAYFIKRYDRLESGDKIHQEDMLSAMGIPNSNENIKYQGSYEAVGQFLKNIGGEKPTIEFIKRVITAYLLGNGDFHLKNISIIYSDDKIEISPVYDYVNTNMYGDTDLLCLDLLINEPEVAIFEDFYCLKRNNFFALSDQVKIPSEVVIEFIDNTIYKNLDKIYDLINNSSFDMEQKLNYQMLITERIGHLRL